MSDQLVPVTRSSFLAPVAAVDEVLAAYQIKKEIVERVLRPGVDFGKIPGSDKDALLKPGAEKFANMYGLAPVFEDVETVEDWLGTDHKGEAFFYYRQKCKLYKGDELMGTADGSCNSWEKKYRYRKQERTCPSCGNQSIIKGKAEYGGGWVCWKKKGGCDGKFNDGDQAIEGQETGHIPNPDVAEQVNTILKMAQKRALVAAVLIVTGASDYFTQDIEDFVEGTFTSPEPPPEPQPEPAKQQTKPANGRKKQPKETNGKPAGIVQALVDAGLSESAPAAATLLNDYVPDDVKAEGDDAILAWAKLYRAHRDSDKTPAEAAELATGGEQPA